MDTEEFFKLMSVSLSFVKIFVIARVMILTLPTIPVFKESVTLLTLSLSCTYEFLKLPPNFFSFSLRSVKRAKKFVYRLGIKLTNLSLK